MWCVFCLDTSLLFNLRLLYLWVLSGNGRRVIFPTVGGKTRLLSQGLFPPLTSVPSPCWSLRFFAEVGTWIEKTTWLVTVKSLVLSCQNCWHMKDWTLFKKKKVKMREWNRVNSYREFILYSCRNLKLLQKCNVVLNYAETFYKSNVNCTFFIQNKSKTQVEHVSFWGESENPVYRAHQTSA